MSGVPLDTEVVDPECFTCEEDPTNETYPLMECVAGKRPCGHHCNCSWVHDCCHWCGGEYDEEGNWVN